MEPMEVTGGPFDLKVSRDGNAITLSVIGKHGDTITQINFAADRIKNVIQALQAVQ